MIERVVVTTSIEGVALVLFIGVVGSIVTTVFGSIALGPDPYPH